MNATKLVMWAVAATSAVVVTSVAVTVGYAAGGAQDNVLSPDEVAQQLADQPAPDRPSGAGPTVTTGEPVTFERTPGRLVAACDGDLAWLESWSPNPGYRVDDVVRGPAAQVSVWFESDSSDDVEVVVTCEAGEPVVTDLAEADDHGGDRDDDNDDGDNSGPGSGGDDHGGDDDNSGPG